MNPKYEGLEIYNVRTHPNKRGFTIGWVAPKIGFGEVTVWMQEEDDEIHIDTEHMSDELASMVLSKAIEFMKREG